MIGLGATQAGTALQVILACLRLQGAAGRVTSPCSFSYRANLVELFNEPSHDGGG